MKKEPVLILMFLFLSLNIFTEEGVSPQSIELVSEAYRFIGNSGPVSEGSESEEAVFEFIRTRLDTRGLSYRTQSLDKLETGHSFSSNLIVTIEGEKEDQLILVVPVHNPPGTGLNTALALGFLNEWSLNTAPLTLTVLFTSADSRRDYPLGSLNYLEEFSFDNPSALIYYSPEFPDSAVELKGSVPFYSAPGWLMERVLHAAEESSVPIYLNIPSILINKSGINDEISPIHPYLSEGIPAVSLLSSEDRQEYGELDWFIQNQLKMLNRIVLDLKQGIPDEWERNYLYGHIPGGKYFYISEKMLIQIFLLFFALGIIVPLVQERRIYLNFRKFKHQLWTIPVILYLTFQFFILSTLIIEEILVYRNQSELVAQYPLIFVLFKTSIVLLLSRVMLNILRGLPFPKSPHFYSYLAFIFALFNVLFGTFLNISYSLFFLWVLVCIILFAIAKGKRHKDFYFFLSLLPVAVFFLYIFRRSYLPVYSFFLLSRVKGNLILTVLTLPFTCMITSLSYYHHHYEKSRHELRSAAGSIFMGVLTLILSYQIMQLQSYTEDFPQRVIMEDYQNLDLESREIHISSKSDMGNGTIQISSDIVNIEDAGKNFKIQGVIEEDLLTISKSTEVFLDRRSIVLNLKALHQPAEIEVRISSDEPIVFYDCDYPYEVLPGEKSARLFIGLNPPNPITIPMVFSRSSRPDFAILYKYRESPYTLTLQKEFLQVESSMVLTKSLPFGEIISN